MGDRLGKIARAFFKATAIPVYALDTEGAKLTEFPADAPFTLSEAQERLAGELFLRVRDSAMEDIAAEVSAADTATDAASSVGTDAGENALFLAAVAIKRDGKCLLTWIAALAFPEGQERPPAREEEAFYDRLDLLPLLTEAALADAQGASPEAGNAPLWSAVSGKGRSYTGELEEEERDFGETLTVLETLDNSDAAAAKSKLLDALAEALGAPRETLERALPTVTAGQEADEASFREIREALLAGLKEEDLPEPDMRALRRLTIGSRALSVLLRGERRDRKAAPFGGALCAAGAAVWIFSEEEELLYGNALTGAYAEDFPVEGFSYLFRRHGLHEKETDDFELRNERSGRWYTVRCARLSLEADEEAYARLFAVTEVTAQREYQLGLERRLHAAELAEKEASVGQAEEEEAVVKQAEPSAEETSAGQAGYVKEEISAEQTEHITEHIKEETPAAYAEAEENAGAASEASPPREVRRGGISRYLL